MGESIEEWIGRNKYSFEALTFLKPLGDKAWDLIGIVPIDFDKTNAVAEEHQEIGWCVLWKLALGCLGEREIRRRMMKP